MLGKAWGVAAAGLAAFVGTTTAGGTTTTGGAVIWVEGGAVGTAFVSCDGAERTPVFGLTTVTGGVVTLTGGFV